VAWEEMALLHAAKRALVLELAQAEEELSSQY
jgi:hypothetical protein